jgi:hypothetical protein
METLEADDEKNEGGLLLQRVRARPGRAEWKGIAGRLTSRDYA